MLTLKPTQTHAQLASRSTLWDRLSQFKVGGTDASHDTFIARLAREERWSIDEAHKIFGEYLRFIYLAATSSVERTPSRRVDMVWHLHLDHAESYNRDLCQGILGRDLKHEAGDRDTASRVRYRNQYAETLAAYEATFRKAPPSEIWPAPGSLARRLNPTGRGLSYTAGLAAGLAGLSLSGVVVGGALLLGGGLAAAAVLKQFPDLHEDYIERRNTTNGSCGGGCGGFGSGSSDNGSGGGDGGSGCGGGGCGGGGD